MSQRETKTGILICTGYPIVGMAQWEEIIQTTVVSVYFLVIFMGLGVLDQTYLSGAFTNPTLVGVALVPVLLFLAVTGRLQRFSGGGFEVVLQEQARKFVSPDASEEVDVNPERLDPKIRESELGKIKERAPTGLTFELGREGFYELGAIEEYLEALETLRYVVFTNADGQFEGYAPVDAFSRLLANFEVDVVHEIETGEITDRPIVRTDAIRSDSTNKECLQKMDDREVDELAVVNSDKSFVGVITQNAIIRKLMSSALRDV